MLVKHPKPKYRKWLKRGAIAAFVIEGLCFVASYTVWHKVNTERDFRLHLKNNYPTILELYYKVGETIGSSDARQVDFAYWEGKAAEAGKSA